MKNRMVRMLVCAMAIVGAVACDDGNGDDGASEALEIVGSYEDDWGSSHVITEESWTATFEGFEPTSSEILSWDADAEYLIAENEDGTFSRYDWTYVGDDLYYCQIEFEADTTEIAEANDGADRGDLDGGGCGGYAWSLLTPVE